MASADAPDWSAMKADARYCRLLKRTRKARLGSLLWFASPGLLALETQRCNFALLRLKSSRGWTPATISLRLLVAVGRLLSLLVAKIDIAGETPIEAGVCLSDRGEMIIGADRIGAGTLIHGQVTIGVNAFQQARPTLGRGVWIGPNCIVYGAIHVGDGATVLPGSVLSMNVPERAVAGGNPAILLARDFDNEALRSSLDAAVDAASFRPA